VKITYECTDGKTIWKVSYDSETLMYDLIVDEIGDSEGFLYFATEQKELFRHKAYELDCFPVHIADGLIDEKGGWHNIDGMQKKRKWFW
jgi:hypothetical protein